MKPDLVSWTGSWDFCCCYCSVSLVEKQGFCIYSDHPWNWISFSLLNHIYHKKRDTERERQRMRKGVLGSTSPIYETLPCARHCAQQITCIVSLNPHLWGRHFHYSHSQMRQLKLRINGLPKIRYLVPVRAHIWDQDGLTLKPIPFTIMLLNYHLPGGTESLMKDKLRAQRDSTNGLIQGCLASNGDTSLWL